MMGRLETDQSRLFYDFCLEDQIPPDHLLRQIGGVLDLDDVRCQLKPFYSTMGRPSVDPELMIRMLIVGYCFVSARNGGFVRKCTSIWLTAGSAAWV